jgi:cyclomaltodextrinase / maltogenic alpha-amylase / neopullulanase
MYRFLLIVSSLFFLFGTSFAQNLDSMDVAFRYDEPAKQNIRTYLPGDFNNWGPNNNGVIAVDAPSIMTYNASKGYWVKQIRLNIGGTHYYKFHIHTDSTGAQYQWVSDPLNPLADNSGYGNSVVTITDPMIFEPYQSKTNGDSINGITVNLLASKGFLVITLIIDADSIDVSSARDGYTGILHYVISPAVPSTSDMKLFIKDAIGRTLTYSFHRDSIIAVTPNVPEWSKDAVWYQIFPERFRNGDTTNNPVRASLEHPQWDPVSWRISPWTGDWYSRDGWEVEKGSDFYSSVFDRRYGGDLQGVIDKLDYLDSLGITAIYFNPVFYAPSLHKYDATAFHHIDPYFGPDPEGDLALIEQETLDSTTWHWTSADTLFLGLLREAHRRGLKVIIDGVFDHCGIYFYAFKDLAQRQQNSPYVSWYTVYSFDDPNTSENEFSYKGWWGVTSMPEFAQSADGSNMADEPKQYMFTVTRRWMDPNHDGNPTDGVDGWRLDVVPDVPIGFWAEWNTLVQHINSNAYTVSEVWGDASYYINKGGFSGTMNYYGCGIPIYDFLTSARSTASSFASRIANNLTIYGSSVALANQNLVDSHDTERLMSMIINAPISNGFQTVNNPRASTAYTVRAPNESEHKLQRLVAFTQMTVVGAPMIYYGDEAGMWGATDPDDRKPMPWPDLAMSPEATDPRGNIRTPDNANFNDSIYKYYRKVIALRHKYPELCRGGFQQLSSNDQAQILAFSRSYNGKTILSIINRSSQTQKIDIPLALLPYQTLQSFGTLFVSDGNISGITYSIANNIFSVNLPPITGVLMRNASPSSTGISVRKGWNLISLPLEVPDGRVSSLFPDAITRASFYGNLGYQETDSLLRGIGYWLKCDSTTVVSVGGLPIDNFEVPVTAGWNLIGAFSTVINTASIISSPPGIILSSFFEYNAGYNAAQALQPGRGYWVKVSAMGILKLSPSK